MSTPLVAIVGRPNVGKSTLVNRLASSQEAIVDSSPGVTRDRNYIRTEWNGTPFSVIDTGGLNLASKEKMMVEISKQAQAAVEEASLIILLVDGRAGILPGDNEIVDIIRKENKPAIIAVNKIDIPELEDLKNEFYKFGLGNPQAISASHGLGIGELLDTIVKKIPPVEVEEGEAYLNIAIVGRPNVGKSSLFNYLIGQERAIVSEEPGTTRDAIDTFIMVDGIVYRFIDTAGLRKKGKLSGEVEYYGLIRSLKALERADLALIVIDSGEGITEGDQRVAMLAEERGCASLILLNKWDLIGEESKGKILKELGRKMVFLDYAPVLRISALTGRGISKIFPIINRVGLNYFQQVKTNKINKLVSEIKSDGHLPSKSGKVLKIYYATQTGIKPPRFLFFVNDTSLVDNTYRRYMAKTFRSKLNLEGCPVFLSFRKKGQKKG